MFASWQTWLWLAGLIVVTTITYSGALDTPFLLDDPINITKNETISHPLGIAALLRDPRAVVTASLRWNYLAGGFTEHGYHVLNVAAHALTGCLVFVLSLATLRLGVFEDRYRAAAVPLAGVAAAIFLLHPMQTESVTYVIQRAEIFVSAGLLGALLSLVAMRGGISLAGIVGLVVSCVIGMYSKPSFAVVPALLLAYDVCFLSRGRMAGVVSRWPVYAISAAAMALTFAITKLAGSFEGPTQGFDIEGITPFGYLAAQPGVVVHYLRTALWPAHLCFDCGYRGPWPVVATFLGSSVAVPALILALVAAGSLAAWKKQPLVTFAVFGSAIVLAPTSTVIPLADFYVEHRMYLPIAFLAMALVPGAYDGLRALASRFALPATGARIAGAALGVLACASLAVATTRRNDLLGNPTALMEDAVRQAPQNERLQYNLANAYKREGRLDDAIPHYEAAIRLLPNVIRSYQNLGTLYLSQNRLDDALRVFLAGVKAKPDVGMAHRNLATTYLRLGRNEEALEAAREAVRVEPAQPNGLKLVGDALLALGRRDEAERTWREGQSQFPNDSSFSERLSRLGPG